jgi:flagellar hook-length control protein FliK
VITRSVVFEVAQTDLGRVNVRVAMAHDTVHAYLSTDRPDVGNALMNGQDRLQSALQASGLEMGQFRVHIDRQSAGSGGQEWLAREYGDRSSQQQGHHRQQDQQQDQPTDAARNNRQRLSGLSVFA